MSSNGVATYSQKLKPPEIQKIFDVLGIPWRDHKANQSGWVAIPDYDFISGVRAAGFAHIALIKPGVNILHGGWIDYWAAGFDAANDVDDDPTAKGDIVDLVRMFLYGRDDSQEASREAIQWIQKTLNKGGELHLEPGQILAKNAIADKADNYVMVPSSIWKSAEISPAAKIVWMAVFDRCGNGKHFSFAGMEKLSKDTGLARSTVQLRIQELIDHGFIVEVERGIGRAPNRYPIIYDKNLHHTGFQ